MSWNQGLIHSMSDPKLILIKNDLLVVLKDLYPKARHHFLVLPYEKINSIFDLNESHIKLIKEMEFMGFNAIELTAGNVENFKMGFHNAPSMQRLHLHVISKDFISDRLKTKTHFNSFNTKFFLTVKQVTNFLEMDGKIKKPDEYQVKKLLSTELKCNQCDYSPKNMPDLKNHLLTHKRFL